MAKIKILKKLPKSKVKYSKKKSTKQPVDTSSKYADEYLKFYDDIKIPTRRYDW